MKYLIALGTVALLGAGCASQTTVTPPVAPAPQAPAQGAAMQAQPPAAQQPANPSLQPSAPPKVKTGAITVQVEIKDTAFAPQVMAVHAGDTVVWTNKGTSDQNVSGIGSALLWDSGNIKPGETFKRTFDEPGTYAYTSSAHKDMKGQVVVYEVEKN